MCVRLCDWLGIVQWSPSNRPTWLIVASESEMYLFDPYKKCIQSNNEMILDQSMDVELYNYNSTSMIRGPLLRPAWSLT